MRACARREAWPLGVFFGSVTFERPPESVDQMARLADELMYSAKTSGKSGKNRLAKRVIGGKEAPSRL